MRKKTFRKLRKLASRYYELECDRATSGMGGIGGSTDITQGRLNKHAKIKKFLYGHPKYKEYEKIMGAYANAVCLMSFKQTWEGNDCTYRSKLWWCYFLEAYERQKEIWEQKVRYRNLLKGKARLRFVAQVWVNDNTMSVDPMGKTDWLVPIEAIDFDFDNEHEKRDELRLHENAPDWVKDWYGPLRS